MRLPPLPARHRASLAVASLAVASLACALPGALAAQGTPAMPAGHRHTPGMVHDSAASSRAASPTVGPGALPTQAGQSAFAALGEIVAILDADPTTDWARVDLERLRAHLRDMDLVTLRAVAATTPVPGGFDATLTGDAATAAAARRMWRAHGAMLAAAGAHRVMVTDVPAGVRVRVRLADAADARGVARLRTLGPVGLLTGDDHHVRHHLALARGGDPDGHAH